MTDTGDDDESVPVAWLDQRLTVEEAEAANPGIQDERAVRDPDLGKPFGGQNARWERLKDAMEPGDEIWSFASPADSWEHLAGRAGIALVRNGRVVTSFVTMMN